MWMPETADAPDFGVRSAADLESAGISTLVSLVLGGGRESAASCAAAHRLLQKFPQPHHLIGASQEELQRAAAIHALPVRRLLAALALGRWACSTPLRPGQRFANSRDIYHRYRARYYAATREHFLSLHLNSKNQLLREVLVSLGSLSTSVVHPREAFASAVRDSAAALVFLHNHPSGDPSPSREDRECTNRLISAGRILGIRVLDHIILGFDDYFSFADAGILDAGLESLPASP